MASYLITAYLILVILLGLQGIFLGIYLGGKIQQDTLSRRRLPRGCLWAVTGIIMLILFRSGMITSWGVILLSTGVTLVLAEYALVIVEKGWLKRS